MSQSALVSAFGDVFYDKEKALYDTEKGLDVNEVTTEVADFDVTDFNDITNFNVTDFTAVNDSNVTDFTTVNDFNVTNFNVNDFNVNDFHTFTNDFNTTFTLNQEPQEVVTYDSFFNTTLVPNGSDESTTPSSRSLNQHNNSDNILMKDTQPLDPSVFQSGIADIDMSYIEPLSITKEVTFPYEQALFGESISFDEVATVIGSADTVQQPIVTSRFKFGTKHRNPKPKGSKNQPPFAPDPVYSNQPLYTDYDAANDLQNNCQEHLTSEKEKSIIDKCCSKTLTNITRPIVRERFLRRDFHQFQPNHDDYIYQKYEDFDEADPYAPEFIRVRVETIFDSKGNFSYLPYNNTRQGLCPYCPSLSFYDLKTTAYGQHLAYHHGVYLNGFITPNPLHYGDYMLKKQGKNRKTNAHVRHAKGVVCPVCHDVVEVELSKTTSKVQPLYNYLRHFKNEHRKYDKKADEFGFYDKMSYHSC